MQENGRMNWLEQIHQMKNRDIRTIEQHELQELPQDAVEHGLPQEERLKNLLDKVPKSLLLSGQRNYCEAEFRTEREQHTV